MGVHQRHKVKLGKVRLERSTKAFHTLLETEREREEEKKKRETSSSFTFVMDKADIFFNESAIRTHRMSL